MDPADVMGVTALSSGQKLGGGSRAAVDARAAAVAAAQARSPQRSPQRVPASAARDASGPGAAAGASEREGTAAEGIEGMGHRDTATEDKERAARELSGQPAG